MNHLIPQRKGISFTLTLVVIGVVLLMTALTVIVLGGGEIGSQIGRSGEASLQNSIQQKCQTLGTKIDNNYCEWNVNSGVDDRTQRCGDIRNDASSAYDQRATDVPCDWYIQAHEDSDAGARLRQYLKSPSQVVDDTQRANQLKKPDPERTWREDLQMEPLVLVQGQYYNCLQEAEISRICPAN